MPFRHGKTVFFLHVQGSTLIINKMTLLMQKTEHQGACSSLSYSLTYTLSGALFFPYDVHRIQLCIASRYFVFSHYIALWKPKWMLRPFLSIAYASGFLKILICLEPRTTSRDFSMGTRFRISGYYPGRDLSARSAVRLSANENLLIISSEMFLNTTE